MSRSISDPVESESKVSLDDLADMLFTVFSAVRDLEDRLVAAGVIAPLPDNEPPVELRGL